MFERQGQIDESSVAIEISEYGMVEQRPFSKGSKHYSMNWKEFGQKFGEKNAYGVMIKQSTPV